MMKIAVAVFAVTSIIIGLTMIGCTDSPTATRALQALGLKNIQATGYAFFGCGEGDTFHTRFTAQNEKGQVITGVVCSGWLKGSTVRFD